MIDGGDSEWRRPFFLIIINLPPQGSTAIRLSARVACLLSICYATAEHSHPARLQFMSERLHVLSRRGKQERSFDAMTRWKLVGHAAARFIGDEGCFLCPFQGASAAFQEAASCLVGAPFPGGTCREAAYLAGPFRAETCRGEGPFRAGTCRGALLEAEAHRIREERACPCPSS